MRNLGQSGLKVSGIGLGGMPLSINGRPDEKTAIEVIKQAAVHGGINFFDTADVYCLNKNDIGHNERLLSKALNGLDDVIIATKGGMARTENGDWTHNAQPKHLQEACEKSLRALNVDQIQLYQLHAPDPSVMFEKSIEKLADLQNQGKIKHVGLSNVNVSQIQNARGIVEIVSVQNRCNVHDKSSFESGVVDYCIQNNIAFIPYSPVGGKFRPDDIGDDKILIDIGKQYNANAFQIALAWLLSKAPNIIPIPGASKVSSVMNSVASMNINLSVDDIYKIDAI